MLRRKGPTRVELVASAYIYVFECARVVDDCLDSKRSQETLYECVYHFRTVGIDFVVVDELLVH